MSEIGTNYNSTNPLYTGNTSSSNVSEGQAARNRSGEGKPAAAAQSAPPTMEELMAKDPNLRRAFNNLVALAGDPGMSDNDVFSLQRLIASLIDLGQALQQAATIYADRLARVTDRMTAYSKMLGQIPVITKEQINWDKLGSDDQQRSGTLGNINQKYGTMLETVRTNKGLEEDKAKKIQTIMQTMKDAGQSANDFIGTFIDLFRGISQKIAK